MLSIAIPTHTDHCGLWLTGHALRQYHGPELAEAGISAEIVVVDNAPDAGPKSRTARLVQSWSAGPIPARYVAAADPPGAAPAKNRAVAESRGELVIGIDSHVMIAPGALVRLWQWWDTAGRPADLLHGPLLGDNGRVMATHFADRWRGGMWGTWAIAWRCPCGWLFHSEQAKGNALACYGLADRYDQPSTATARAACPDCGRPLPTGPWPGHETLLEKQGFVHAIEGGRETGKQGKGEEADDEQPSTKNQEPFSIPASGMGLFAVAREAWLGFHPGARQFGGEEWTIHERYRQAGRGVVCLPWLQWTHRFRDAAYEPVPFRATHGAKVRNYVLEMTSLGLPLDRCRRHFSQEAKPAMPADEFDRIVAAVRLGSEPPDESPPVAPPAAPRRCGDCPQTAEAKDQEPKTKNQPLPLPHAARLGDLLRGRRVLAYGPSATPMDWTAVQSLGPAVLIPIGDEDSPSAATAADVALLATLPAADRVYAGLVAVAASSPRIVILGAVAVGETYRGGPGILPAIRRFVRDRPAWRVHEHHTDGPGLTLLSRDPADRPPLPGLWRQLRNFAQAAAGHAAAGLARADEATIAARLDLCATCPQRHENRCAVCGCYIEVKATWREQPCPLGYWPIVSGTLRVPAAEADHQREAEPPAEPPSPPTTLPPWSDYDATATTDPPSGVRP